MTHMNTWPFSDPPNVAVIANRRIMEGKDWIAYVSHDLDDGAWQFHIAAPEVHEGDMIVVSLESVIRLDSSVQDLAELPLGWHAWRESFDAPWKRAVRAD